jgi:hypothetical protein
MDSYKIAELFNNIVRLQHKLNNLNQLTEEEEIFLDWTNKAIDIVEEGAIKHFLLLCSSYNEVTINPVIQSNGTFKDESNRKVEDGINLAAGVAMAEAGLFDGLASNASNEVDFVEEDVVDLDELEDDILSEAELEELSSLAF